MNQNQGCIQTLDYESSAEKPQWELSRPLIFCELSHDEAVLSFSEQMPSPMEKRAPFDLHSTPYHHVRAPMKTAGY